MAGFFAFMSKSFYVGNCPVPWVEFYDENGTLVDPTNVFIEIMDPSTNIDGPYQYGVHATVEKESTGYYKYTGLCIDEEGEWHVKWYSTGTYQAAVVLRFAGKRSPFD